MRDGTVSQRHINKNVIYLPAASTSAIL